MNIPHNLPRQVSLVLIALFKGVLYQDKNPELWRDLLTYQGAVRDYTAVLGLQIFLDQSGGIVFASIGGRDGFEILGVITIDIAARESR